jgi:transposase
MDVAKALEALRERRAQAQAQAEMLARDGLKQLVMSEPDAKLMRTANGHHVAYNAQSAVDAKHKLIAAFELTNEGNDARQLHPMAELAKEALAVDALTVVADTGYSSGEQGERCAASQITAIVPRPEATNTSGAQYFARDRFAYDGASDTYRCPAGQILELETVERRVTRTKHEPAIEAMHKRAMSDPKWMNSRRELAEHPFGTIKWMLGNPRFLLRGLVKAKAELALSVLCYNMKRVLNLLGVPELLRRMQALPI